MIDKLIIKGGTSLKGRIRISGSKNASLPMMVASILTSESVILNGVPCLSDIDTMTLLLQQQGVKISMLDKNKRIMMLNAGNVNNFEAHHNIVSKIRASILILGALLARFGKARVALPGGCAIGTRPINFHIEALKNMGASIVIEDGYINAHCDGLVGIEYEFKSVSVGATEHVAMAACLADGVTKLYNCAIEPEVINLLNLLVEMGADIQGIGTRELIVTGKKELHGCRFDVIKDRIEVSSYVLAAAVTKGRLLLEGRKYRGSSRCKEHI